MPAGSTKGPVPKRSEVGFGDFAPYHPWRISALFTKSLSSITLVRKSFQIEPSHSSLGSSLSDGCSTIENRLLLVIRTKARKTKQRKTLPIRVCSNSLMVICGSPSGTSEVRSTRGPPSPIDHPATPPLVLDLNQDSHGGPAMKPATKPRSMLLSQTSWLRGHAKLPATSSKITSTDRMRIT